MMTLWDLTQNEVAFISGFSDLLSEKYRARMRDLGVGSGETIRCERKIPFNGPRIYRVGGSIFSIDRDIASQVLISRDNPSGSRTPK